MMTVAVRCVCSACRARTEDIYRMVGVCTNSELSAHCDAAWLLQELERDAGPVGGTILKSARQHLEDTLRDYLTKGKGSLGPETA